MISERCKSLGSRLCIRVRLIVISWMGIMVSVQISLESVRSAETPLRFNDGVHTSADNSKSGKRAPICSDKESIAGIMCIMVLPSSPN